MPDRVEEIRHAVQRDNPGISDNSAYAVAWDAYNKMGGLGKNEAKDFYLEADMACDEVNDLGSKYAGVFGSIYLMEDDIGLDTH